MIWHVMWREKSLLLFELCKFSLSTHPLPLFFDFVCLHSVILILLLFKWQFDSHVCNFILKQSQSVSTAHSADYDWLCVDPCGIIMHYSGQITHPEMIRLGIIVTVARPGLTLSHQDTRHLLSLSLFGRSLLSAVSSGAVSAPRSGPPSADHLSHRRTLRDNTW